MEKAKRTETKRCNGKVKDVEREIIKVEYKEIKRKAKRDRYWW